MMEKAIFLNYEGPKILQLNIIRSIWLLTFNWNSFLCKKVINIVSWKSTESFQQIIMINLLILILLDSIFDFLFMILSIQMKRWMIIWENIFIIVGENVPLVIIDFFVGHPSLN